MDDAKDIYYREYWLASGCQRLAPDMAIVVFDSAVQHGPTRAKEWLDNNDDVFGYLVDRTWFYRGLTAWTTFKGGWKNRLAGLAKLVSESENPVTQASRLFLIFGGIQVPLPLVKANVVRDKLYARIVK